MLALFDFDKGKMAEKAALKYLEQQGFSLIAKNYRNRRGEIDLIVENDNLVLIVEVRYRSHSAFGLASETIDARKQAKIIQCAEQFLAQNPVNKSIRIDVITVSPGSEDLNINWIKDAFRA